MKLFILLFSALVFTAHGATEREIKTGVVTLKQQASAPASPASGSYKSYVRDGKLRLKDSAGAEATVGSGAGGSRLNLLADGSFEEGVTDGSCSGCTASSEATVILTTPNNTAALKMAFSASSGSYTADKSTDSQYSNVQGLAACWIKTDQAGITFKSRRDGADSLSVDVSSDGLWHYYEIPDLTGSTSFGYKVNAASSITGNVYVDECFAGPAKILSDVANVGQWTAYTPTFTGFGTVSVQTFQWRQVGDSIHINGRFTLGTTTATEARISLPLSYVSSSSYTTLHVVGIGGINAVNQSIKALIEPSVGYITLGVMNSTTADLVKINGNGFASGGVMSIDATIRVAGLDASVNSYSSSCGADVQCENEFSAKVSSTGVVSDESLDWIEGNCVITATSTATCTYKTGVFSVAPNCTLAQKTATLMQFISAESSSSVSVRSVNTSDGSASPSAFEIICQKQGEDFKARRSIIGTFENHVKTPGVARPVLVSASIATTGVVSEEEDDFVNGSCTKTGTGSSITTCTFSTNYWASNPHCWMVPWADSGESLSQSIDTNSTTTFASTGRSGTTATNRKITFFCKGAKQ